MRVVALDYGRARTGMAVSDPTGTVVRPLGVVAHVRTPQGMDELVAAIAEQQPERVVVGLPVTLRGERGRQAQETLAFVRELEDRVAVEIETYDERFTTSMAERSDSKHGQDAVAAAHLLEGYLQRLAG
jgi:putative Holliday junction resolvase